MLIRRTSYIQHIPVNLALILFGLGVIGFILLLLIIGFVSQIKYVFIILISLLFLLFFVLSLKSGESILVNYCNRKKVSNSYILEKNSNCFYFFILIIIPFYIGCTASRLWILIYNTHAYLLRDIFQTEFMSLYLPVIIVILLISTLLVWTDIFNKKHKNGKYNKLSILIGIWLIILLISSIILGLTGWGINYLYILDNLTQWTILCEVISIFISGDSILFSNLEKQIIINYNFDKINFKLNELKNYVNLMILKNKINITNNNDVNNVNINIKRRTISINGYKKIFNIGRRGNIISRGIQFILDFILLIIEKLYTLVKINNGSKLKSIMSMVLPVIANDLNSKNELMIGNINNINMNESNNSRNIVGSNRINNLIVNMNSTYPLLENSIENQSLIASSTSNNQLPTENSTSSVRTSKVITESQNQNLSKKRSNPFVQDTTKTLKKKRMDSNLLKEEIKKPYLPFLNDRNFKDLNLKIFYPHYGSLNIKDICKDVLDDMSKINNNKKDNVIIKDDYINNNHIQFRNLILLPYHQLINLPLDEIKNILMEHTSIYNNSLLVRNIIVNFIDIWQIQELTKATGRMIEFPLLSRILHCNESNKWSAIYKYPILNSAYYSEYKKDFIIVPTRIPTMYIKDQIMEMYKNMWRHSYILDSSLSCKSLIIRVNEELYKDHKKFFGDYKEILNRLKMVKDFVFNDIQLAADSKLINKDEKLWLDKYYYDRFNLYEKLITKRYSFLHDILVDDKLVPVNYVYLNNNLCKWEMINEWKYNKLGDKVQTFHYAEEYKPDVKKVKNNSMLDNAGLNINRKLISQLAHTNFPQLPNEYV